MRGSFRQGFFCLGFFCLAFAALSSAGCATLQENLDQTKMAWQGASYDEVVARWGKPVRTETRPDGAEAHTWISEGPVYRPYGPSIGVGVGAATAAAASESG